MLYPLSYERRVKPEHFSATGHPFRNRFREGPYVRRADAADGGSAGRRLGGNLQVSARPVAAPAARIVRLVTSAVG
jgi:hypothetical protein